MTIRLAPLLSLGLLVAPVLLAPVDARACSWDPFVADSRIEGSIPVCVRAGETSEDASSSDDPYRSDLLSNLRLSSSCDTPVEFDVPDCVDCDGPIVLDENSVVLDVGVDIDETVGEDVEVVVGWSTDDDAGEFTVVFEMANTHPNDQVNGCDGLACNVAGQGGTPSFAALLLLVGAWSRRRRTRR